jgi:hypothetical protein
MIQDTSTDASDTQTVRIPIATPLPPPDSGDSGQRQHVLRPRDSGSVYASTFTSAAPQTTTGSTVESQTTVSSYVPQSPSKVRQHTKPVKLTAVKSARNCCMAMINACLLCVWVWIMVDLGLTVGTDSTAPVYMSATVPAQLQGTFNESFHVLQFTGLSDAGRHHAKIDTNSGGKWYTAETSLGIYYVVADERASGNNRYLAVGGQACKAGDAIGLVGLLATDCTDTKGCTEYCLVIDPLQPDWDGVVALGEGTFLVPKFDIEDYYRLRNSVGFGEMYLSQSITDVQLINDELVLHTTVVGTDHYNGDWWQRPVIAFVFMILWINATVRFLCLFAIVKGVPIGNNRLTLLVDLAGGLITSPGVQGYSFVAMIIISLHAVVWQDALYLFEESALVSAQVSAIVAIAVTSLFSAVLSGTTFKFYNSGTTVVLISIVVRIFTRGKARMSAADDLHSEGMILGRSCYAWTEGYPNANQSVEFACNHANAIGQSGVELFVKVSVLSCCVGLAF